MNRIVVAIASTVLTGTVSAGVLRFAAKCPNGITADSNVQGEFYVDGKVARLLNRPDGQITAQSGGAHVDVAPQDGQPTTKQCRADGNMHLRGSNRGGFFFIDACDECREIVEALVFGG